MPRTFPWGLLLTLAGFGIACSSSTARDEHTRAAKAPIINGTRSDESQDHVLLLVHYDPAAREFGQCTATLLGPSVVLTARHCVARTDRASACAEDGTPIAGGRVHEDYEADTMYVFRGKERPDFASGAVKADGRGGRILHPDTKTLCNADIAIIELQAPVENPVIAPIRLDEPARQGETITSVGWGVTTTTSWPKYRQQRPGVEIEHVGPFSDEWGVVGDKEFRVGESICSGDSGGPALASETGAVLGVVSRGGNGQGDDPHDPSAQCIGGSNLYTGVAGFKDLILQAFEEVGEEPWIEGGPDPRLARLGEDCEASEACRSGLCVDGKCAQDCSSEACPEGYTCPSSGDPPICTPSDGSEERRASSKGCATTGANVGARSAFGFVAGLLLLTRWLRRKSRAQ